jgi:hypothetical protein
MAWIHSFVCADSQHTLLIVIVYIDCSTYDTDVPKPRIHIPVLGEHHSLARDEADSPECHISSRASEMATEIVD